MAAMAVEPFAVEFKSWELVSSETPVSEEFGLPKMIQDLADVKKKKDDQLLLVRDKKDLLDQLKTQLGETRGGKKAEIQKQIAAPGNGIRDRNRQLQARPGELSPR